jgi:hypothetical protein
LWLAELNGSIVLRIEGAGGVEVYAFLVGATVFKTGETEYLGLAGSIPVRLRHRITLRRWRDRHGQES